MKKINKRLKHIIDVETYFNCSFFDYDIFLNVELDVIKEKLKPYTIYNIGDFELKYIKELNSIVCKFDLVNFNENITDEYIKSIIVRAILWSKNKTENRIYLG